MKNPAGVAARGGVQKGSGQHSKPKARYRATSVVATLEVSQ